MFPGDKYKLTHSSTKHSASDLSPKKLSKLVTHSSTKHSASGLSPSKKLSKLFTHSSTKPTTYDLSPSKKLSKLVYKGDKCKSKKSLIFRAADGNQSASFSSNIESGVGNVDQTVHCSSNIKSGVENVDQTVSCSSNIESGVGNVDQTVSCSSNIESGVGNVDQTVSCSSNIESGVGNVGQTVSCSSNIESGVGNVDQTVSCSSNIESGVGNGGTYDGNTSSISLVSKFNHLQEKSEKSSVRSEVKPLKDGNILELENSWVKDDDVSIKSIIGSDIQNIYKNSFELSGKTSEKSNSHHAIECDESREWSMSTNPFLPADSFKNYNNEAAGFEILAEKIVEPFANHNQSTIDLPQENPVLGTGRKVGIPSLPAMDNIAKNIDTVYSSCSFTKEMLKTIKVIGHVDNKFIACLLRRNKSEETIVFVDQHAAHERIRLENLLNRIGFHSTDEKKINNKSTLLSPAARITIPENDMKLLLHHKREFNDIGLCFSFIRSPNSSYQCVFVYSVPAIFVHGFEYQPEAEGSVVNTAFLKEFIYEQIEFMQSSGCSCNMLSRVIFKALASHACHGAIKFGDNITLSTCKTIMRDLGKCDLPFQCAHGRPTIVPVFKLNFLDGVLKRTCQKPNLSKLKIRKLT